MPVFGRSEGYPISGAPKGGLIVRIAAPAWSGEEERDMRNLHSGTGKACLYQ
ncbi:MAG: hypothetical protein AMXMBFR7_14440 [Planctomycetota bacterium]